MTLTIFLRKNISVICFLVSLPFNTSFSQNVSESLKPPLVYFDFDTDTVNRGRDYSVYPAPFLSSGIHANWDRLQLKLTEVSHKPSLPNINGRRIGSINESISFDDKTPSGTIVWNSYSFSYWHWSYVAASHDVFDFGLQSNESRVQTPYTVAGWFYLDPKIPLTSISEAYDPTSPYSVGKPNIFGGSGSMGMIGIHFNRGLLYLSREVSTLSKYGFYYLGSNFNVTKAGWYFLSLVKDNEATRVYLGGLDGKLICRSFPFRLENPSQMSWTIGDYNNKEVRAVDDFMVWNEALSTSQINSLLQCSKDSYPGDYCWNQSNNESKTIARIADSHELQIQTVGGNPDEENISVFPNPTTGPISILVDLKEASPVFIQVYDLVGRAIINKTMDLHVGSNTVNLYVGNHATCSCEGVSTEMVIIRIATNKMK